MITAQQAEQNSLKAHANLLDDIFKEIEARTGGSNSMFYFYDLPQGVSPTNRYKVMKALKDQGFRVRFVDEFHSYGYYYGLEILWGPLRPDELSFWQKVSQWRKG